MLVREGVIAALPGEELPPLPKFGWRLARLFARRRALAYERSDRLAKAVVRLGPSYVKLGQFLATRPDVVGNDMALDLAMLQDKMAHLPEGRGDAADRGFARAQDRAISMPHSAKPVAAASIAQVHAAEVDP